MTEREVHVSDEFDVECPACNGQGEIGVTTNYDVVNHLMDGAIECPGCNGTGEATVWVEGETTVRVEPVGRY